MTNLKKFLVISLILILIILWYITMSYRWLQSDIKLDQIPATTIVQTWSYIASKEDMDRGKLWYAIDIVRDTPITPENTSSKYEAMRKVRSLFDDTAVSPDIRANAWVFIVDRFFDVWMQLGEPIFGNKNFTEEDIFDFAIAANQLSPTHRLPILISYIWLRFFPQKISADFINKNLNDYKNLNTIKPDTNLCGNTNKIGSIIYLAEKANIILSAEYSDSHRYFNEAMAICPDRRKSTIAFMWLAAISDTPETEINNTKAKELIEFIIKNKSETDGLSINLKQSYFTTNKEPDTESIVVRLTQKYPEFNSYIASY